MKPMLFSFNDFPVRFFDDNNTRRRHLAKRHAPVTARPAVNIEETDEGFDLSLLAPGLSRDAFEVSLDDRVLTIRYEAPAKEENGTTPRWLRKEFGPVAGFERQFRLNDRIVEGDQINATYRDGILYVHVPKKEAAKPQPARQIDVV